MFETVLSGIVFGPSPNFGELLTNVPEKVSRDMGYRSGSIAISRGMGPLIRHSVRGSLLKLGGHCGPEKKIFSPPPPPIPRRHLPGAAAPLPLSPGRPTLLGFSIKN